MVVMKRMMVSVMAPPRLYARRGHLDHALTGRRPAVHCRGLAADEAGNAPALQAAPGLPVQPEMIDREQPAPRGEFDEAGAFIGEAALLQHALGCGIDHPRVGPDVVDERQREHGVDQRLRRLGGVALAPDVGVEGVAELRRAVGPGFDAHPSPRSPAGPAKSRPRGAAPCRSHRRRGHARHRRPPHPWDRGVECGPSCPPPRAGRQFAARRAHRRRPANAARAAGSPV